jgi:hypothetical protein
MGQEGILGQSPPVPSLIGNDLNVKWNYFVADGEAEDSDAGYWAGIDARLQT